MRTAFIMLSAFALSGCGLSEQDRQDGCVHYLEQVDRINQCLEMSAGCRVDAAYYADLRRRADKWCEN